MAALTSALPFSASTMLSSLSNAIWLESSKSAYRSQPISSGYRGLDQELPKGGWPPSVLIELLLSHPDTGELHLLAPTLAQLVRAGKTIVLLAPAHLSFAKELAESGLDKNNIILIKAERPADKIWAVERVMRSANFGALLCWLPQARTDQLRRLQLAAAATQGLSFVFRPQTEQNEVSPAPLRMVCKPLSAGRMSVDIIKRRGPVHGETITLPLAMSEQPQSLATRPLVKPAPLEPIYAVDYSALAATAARHRAGIAC